MMRKVKFQEGGMARSGISNEPVGAALRRLFERRASMQGPPAPGAGQRPQEDRARMAAEAAPQFDEEERRYMEGRRNRGSAITNQPVGERLAGRRPAPAPEPQAAGRSYPIGEGGTLQPESAQRPTAAPSRPRATPRPMARESSAAEDLNEIVLRLTRGEKPVTETEKRIADRMGIAYRKGGMVNKYQAGGSVNNDDIPEHLRRREERDARSLADSFVRLGEAPPRKFSPDQITSSRSPAARESQSRVFNQARGLADAELRRRRGSRYQSVMQGGQKPPKISDNYDAEEYKSGPGSKALDSYKNDLPDKGETKEVNYRKGGMVKPKTAMKKGGAVKPKAPATKMKAGGKVAPKKMMKGGMTSKPKKMMGGGRAMYAKGGMAKGCK